MTDEELNEYIDKLSDHVEHLEHILAPAEEACIHVERIELALATAKQARRTVTFLIRALAEERDNNATA